MTDDKPTDERPEPRPTSADPDSSGGATAVDVLPDEDVSAADDTRGRSLLYRIAAGDVLSGILAFLLAILVGSIMIAATDEAVRESAGYIFARPSDFFSAVWQSVWGAYTAMFRGAVFNYEVDDPYTQWRPLFETLKFAAPLILGGLGVGLAFRAALFNIGGRGQMLVAGAVAGWIAINWSFPTWLHLPLAVIGGLIAGALWGGIAGLLKARTGAHEVIVTIMLNYVGYYLVLYALSTQGWLQAPGSVNPKSLPMKETAQLPLLLGDRFTLHAGFLLALVAVAIVWWLLNHSTLGYRIRAVGENPNAARASGINVGRTYTTVMMLAGGLVGLAGVNQVLGTVTSGVTADLDAGIGFDAITVALLGRSRPLGILAAGLLFGAFKAGGFRMQSSEGIGVDIVLVVQGLIVLFLAAPPLVRAMFRLPNKEAK